MSRGHFLTGSHSELFEVLMQENQSCFPQREGKDLAVSSFFCQSERQDGYGKILREIKYKIPDQLFRERVGELFAHVQKGQAVYWDTEHRERYEGLRKNSQILALNEKPSYAAALYLLSADGYLWGKARDVITLSQVLFMDIRLGGINVRGYILYHLARDLYYRSDCVKISDLTDQGLVNQHLFSILFTGCLIREYGLGAVEQMKMV